MTYGASYEQTIVLWVHNKARSWHGGLKLHPKLFSGGRTAFIDHYKIKLSSAIEYPIFSVESYGVKKEAGLHLPFTSEIILNTILFLPFRRFWTAVWGNLHQLKHNVWPNLIKKDYKNKRKSLSSTWKVKANSQNMVKREIDEPTAGVFSEMRMTFVIDLLASGFT